MINQNKMKQTAVEWLIEQISSSKYFYKLIEDINSRSTITQSNIFHQAKEMEKEQIMDAFNFNNIKWTPKFDDEGNISITNEIICNNSEQYYNETFKSE